uniref:Uncharacterized protein n=1 Tax=Rhodopseudomonas palustris (strain BisA53) TaxID=316055 RepID=Q07I42_RHOP5
MLMKGAPQGIGLRPGEAVRASAGCEFGSADQAPASQQSGPQPKAGGTAGLVPQNPVPVKVEARPEWASFSVSRARCGILHAASQTRDPGSALRETGAPDQQRTTPRRGGALRCIRGTVGDSF